MLRNKLQRGQRSRRRGGYGTGANDGLDIVAILHVVPVLGVQTNAATLIVVHCSGDAVRIDQIEIQDARVGVHVVRETALVGDDAAQTGRRRVGGRVRKPRRRAVAPAAASVDRRDDGALGVADRSCESSGRCFSCTSEAIKYC